jgi:hypothetical protein
MSRRARYFQSDDIPDLPEKKPYCKCALPLLNDNNTCKNCGLRVRRNYLSYLQRLAIRTFNNRPKGDKS